MNVSGGEAGLRVMTIGEWVNYPIELNQPLLVTQIETRAQLNQLVNWLQPQTIAHPLTLISPLQGQSFTQSVSELAHLTDDIFPLQVYIPARITPQAIALQKLIDVVVQLRHPQAGCPWDLEQTPETLIPYIIEEAYETVDAIRQGDQTAIAEELGDLLLQVVLQAQIAQESQQFSLTEVAQGIAQKLIRRHPHVFGSVQVNSVEEVHANWDAIKAEEKGESVPTQTVLSQKLQRYARRLPPLMAGLKLSEKAATAGFEWPDMNGVWAKFYEELAEFQEALLQNDVQQQEAELGDLLFTLVNIARWCQIDPSAALHSTNLKLIERVQTIEAQTDKPLPDHSPQELDRLWQKAKQLLKKQFDPQIKAQMELHIDSQIDPQIDPQSEPPIKPQESAL